MESFFHNWGIAQLFTEAQRTLLNQVEAAIVLAQCALIIAAGVGGYWFGKLIRTQLTKFASKSLPRNWAPTFIRVCQSVVPPLFWLFVLWLVGAISGLVGYPLALVNAAIALLLAWIFIRILSFTVKSPIASVATSVVAWSIASLSILGLFGPLIHELDVSALQIGKIRISFLTAITAVFVLVALLWLTSILANFLQRQIERSKSLTPSLQVLLTQVLKITLPIAAILIALEAAGIDITAFTVVFGAVGLGVGLGLQRVASNLFAGLTLLVGETIRPGDIIEYKNSYGWVTAMGARYVTLRTRDGVEHLIPNDYFLENGVENWSHSDQRLRLHVPVGVAYETDLHQAIALCIDAAKSVERVLDRPEPLCLLKGFGDSSVNLEIRAWIEDPRNGTQNVKSAILLAVWDRFKEAGITIPFPQRDVHIVSMPRPEPLP